MTTASATCDATRRCRKRCPPRVSVPERESSRRREARSPRAARRDGRTPKSSTANTVTPDVRATGVPARRITSVRGSCAGANATRRRSKPPAHTRPRPPPAVASNTLSARIRRVTWLELAPSARRITISGARSEARSSSRLPTFTQTMRSSKVTAAVSATRIGFARSEEHTSELQSLAYLVCRLLAEKKNTSELQSLAYIVYRLLIATNLAVVDYLNTEKVPDLFVASGCHCWNDASNHPYTVGWQTDY